MPPAFDHRRRHPAGWAVVALHLLAVLALWRLQPWADRERAAPPPPPIAWIRWPEPAAADTAPTPEAPGPREPRSHPIRPAAPTTPTAPAAPTAPITPITPPAATEAPPPAPGAITAVPPPDPAGALPGPPGPASAPPPLNLSLPRGAWRGAVDPERRAESGAPGGVEARIAAALGGVDGIVQERLDADRLRLRRGSQCIELRRSRAGQLDPTGPFRDLWQGRPC